MNINKATFYFLAIIIITTSPVFSQGSWTHKADFSGSARSSAVVLKVETKEYIATGNDSANTSSILELIPPCTHTLSVSTTNATCGQANGTASVTVSGGSAPFTYHWTNGDLAALADSLMANLYMVTVTDASGCVKSAPALINNVGSPIVTVSSVKNVSCNGGGDGAIDISVAGGVSPYTYYWVNGATTQDVTNLVAGSYQVGVSGANGCVSMTNVSITEPTVVTLSVSIVDASCGSPNGSATALPSGGNGAFSYLWSTGATTATTTGLSAGGYSVTVTDSKGCAALGMAPIINAGGAVIAIDSIIPVTCGGSLGSIYISVTGGSPPYSYAWSNGATTQDLVGAVSGPYSLVVSGGNTCTGAFMGVVPKNLPSAPTICLVTVDSITDKNVCVFKKDTVANPGISHYNFYRESIVAGQYQLLGSKAANLPSQWTDQSANPLQHSWRYKISAVDTCGTESALSPLHKTIHLSASIGLNNKVNLIWDDYEGFFSPTFIIYRYTVAGGWDSLDAVSGNVHAYTDINSPVPLINVNYFVAIVNPSPCKLSIKNPIPMASNLNLSKSNVNKINPTATGVYNPEWAYSISIFPNPSSGIFTIRSSAIIVTVEVLDVVGKLIYSGSLTSGSNQLNLSKEVNGIYFLKIKSEEGISTKKIIVNK